MDTEDIEMEERDESPSPLPNLRASASVPGSSSRLSQPSYTKSNSTHNIFLDHSMESFEEMQGGDSMPALPSSDIFSRFSKSITSARSNSKEEEEDESLAPSKPLGDINILKLKNSMQLRSAYLNCDLDSSDHSEGEVEDLADARKSLSDHVEDGNDDGGVSSQGSSSGSDGVPPSPSSRNERERDNVILTFEMFSNGEQKYFHRSMRNLFIHMLKSAQHNDDISKEANSDTDSSSKGVSYGSVGYMQLRDLRRLEYLFTPQEEPAIFVRRHAVIISLDPLRVVVMADRLILIVPDGADTLIQLLSNQMHSYIASGDSKASMVPFETRAYEAIFGTVIEIQKLHLSDLDSRIKKVSSLLRKYSIVPVEVQEKVQHFKQRVSEMIERARAHKRILEELLDEDDLLSLMALSLLKTKPHLYNMPLENEILATREEAESMLESYLMDYNSIQSKLTLLRSQLQGAEALVSLRLDTSRNELLITNTVVSVVSCTFAIGGYVGALFGMNLTNGFEDDPTSTFWTVSITTTILVVFATIFTILYLKFSEILPSRFNKLSRIQIRDL